MVEGLHLTLVHLGASHPSAPRQCLPLFEALKVQCADEVKGVETAWWIGC